MAWSLLAASALLTLVATPNATLFLQSDLSPAGPACGGSVRSLNLYCLVPGSSWVDVSAWISIAILLIAISGLAPAITPIPHWYVSWSAAISFGLVDTLDPIANQFAASGGDSRSGHSTTRLKQDLRDVHRVGNLHTHSNKEASSDHMCSRSTVADMLLNALRTDTGAISTAAE
ncbi:hypothetical protein FQR65_LT20146 [Abscondita terminalis]|nr:hypothetical protein FQR65_LT20146 [Abscondita terminalis]